MLIQFSVCLVCVALVALPLFESKFLETTHNASTLFCIVLKDRGSITLLFTVMPSEKGDCRVLHDRM